jgi:capsular exopolysaccharide synthesis family protein
MSVPAKSLEVVAHHQDEARLVPMVAPESMAAEQYRALLSRLDRICAERLLRTIAITSCGRGEGRSLTAANLCLTAALENREVALVECDLRRPSLARIFDLAPRAGLAEVVEGRAELPQALSRVGKVAVLCAGEARDPAAAMRSPRLAATLDTLRASHERVVLDAPPALALTDAGRLSSAVDGVVLVVRAGQTPRDVVRMAVEALAHRLVGIVLNCVEEPSYARYLRTEEAGQA